MILKVIKRRFNIILFVIYYASFVYCNDVESFTIIKLPFFLAILCKTLAFLAKMCVNGKSLNRQPATMLTKHGSDARQMA